MGFATGQQEHSDADRLSALLDEIDARLRKRECYGRNARRPDSDEADPMVVMRDLLTFGINYHANHLRRLWMAGRFPKPVHLSARKLAWRRSTILEWLSEREQAGGE